MSRAYYESLPADQFPKVRATVDQLFSGGPAERFELGASLDGGHDGARVAVAGLGRRLHRPWKWAVMTTLVVGRGAAGWLALAGLFTLAVLAAMPATRWALRTSNPRQHRPAHSH